MRNEPYRSRGLTLLDLIALLCAWAALGAAALAVHHAAVFGAAGSELGAAVWLACIALILDWPPYDGGPRDLPGAPRAGIDTQE
jgi:hypothetical protein